MASLLKIFWFFSGLFVFAMGCFKIWSGTLMLSPDDYYIAHHIRSSVMNFLIAFFIFFWAFWDSID